MFLITLWKEEKTGVTGHVIYTDVKSIEEFRQVTEIIQETIRKS